jgi:hypothetical protein
MINGKTEQDLAHGIADHCGRSYFFLLLRSRKVECGILHCKLPISLRDVNNPWGQSVVPNGVPKSRALLSSKMGRSIAAFIAPAPVRKSRNLGVDVTGVDRTLVLGTNFEPTW